MTAPDVIEESAMQRIHRIGGSVLVNELIAIFLKNTPERILSARAGAEVGNINQVLLAAHSLKSSCANLGAQRMRHVAAQIEKVALNGDATPLRSLIPQLDDAFQEVRHALEHRDRHPSRKARIAVVEDNADNRLLVRAMLEDLYDISEYGTGAEALADIHAAAPSLILLDISLPGMDGYAVLNAIRGDSRFAKLPVIALTAHAMTGDRDKILAAGFDDYVAKPIDDETVLLRSIERLLKR